MSKALTAEAGGKWLRRFVVTDESRTWPTRKEVEIVLEVPGEEEKVAEVEGLVWWLMDSLDSVKGLHLSEKAKAKVEKNRNRLIKEERKQEKKKHDEELAKRKQQEKEERFRKLSPEQRERELAKEQRRRQKKEAGKVAFKRSA